MIPLYSIFSILTKPRFAGNVYGQPGESSRTVTVGLCTGLLAAAAVASAPALPALIPLGVEVVLIAFRTGLCVRTAARSLELSSDGASSWSHVVTGINDKEALDILASFHRAKVSVPILMADLY